MMTNDLEQRLSKFPQAPLGIDLWLKRDDVTGLGMGATRCAN
jgi:1-aminocyclopropane-1-carboxylate deaminase/D-cysteine desulfhydrase-like pyridoxal-dependent ACC family enzyme